MYKSKKLLQHISPVKGRRGHDRLVVGLKLHMQSVPITTNVASYNPSQTRCTRYNIM